MNAPLVPQWESWVCSIGAVLFALIVIFSTEVPA